MYMYFISEGEPTCLYMLCSEHHPRPDGACRSMASPKCIKQEQILIIMATKFKWEVVKTKYLVSLLLVVQKKQTKATLITIVNGADEKRKLNEFSLCIISSEISQMTCATCMSSEE